MKTTRKTIHNTGEFLALIGPAGRVTEPVQLDPRRWLFGLTGLTSLAGVAPAEGCGLHSYIPWGIRFYANRLDIGCETFLLGVTDEYIRDVIARHRAAEHTDRIFEAVNLWRGWIA